jgi:hypothetical protein
VYKKVSESSGTLIGAQTTEIVGLTGDFFQLDECKFSKGCLQTGNYNLAY